MFFKRETPRAVSYREQLSGLQSSGYAVEDAGGGKSRVVKGNLAAIVEEGGGGLARLAESGLLIGREVAVLTDLGFQKIFLTPGGKKTPALAEHLHALHAFVEDLREALGLTSLYNEGLGTTNEQHLYDRVKDRDQGVAPRPWEKA